MASEPNSTPEPAVEAGEEEENRLLDDEDPEGGVWQQLNKRERVGVILAVAGVAAILAVFYYLGTLIN